MNVLFAALLANRFVQQLKIHIVSHVRQMSRLIGAENASRAAYLQIAPPESVTGLVTVAKLRNMASLCGIAEITQVGDNMLFYLSKLDINKLGAVTSPSIRFVSSSEHGAPHIIEQTFAITILRNVREHSDVI